MDKSGGGAIPFGENRGINGHLCVHCHGYWIRAYQVRAGTLRAK